MRGRVGARLVHFGAVRSGPGRDPGLSLYAHGPGRRRRGQTGAVAAVTTLWSVSIQRPWNAAIRSANGWPLVSKQT